MALTETFEYDCEVRGPHKAVQVRKIRIIKDGDQEVSRTYIAMFWHVELSPAGFGATPTSLARRVQAVCNAVWTQSIKDAYEAAMDAQELKD